MSLFIPLKFRTTVQLSPMQIDSNFEETIVRLLRERFEGVCSRFGYIKKGTVDVTKRSLGLLMKPHFNGYIRFDILAKGDVCNPIKGMTLKAVIKNKNQVGILAECYDDDEFKTPILDVIVPKASAGIASDVDIDDLEIGETISIQVLGTRYKLNDKKISVIGKIIKTVEVLSTAQSQSPIQEGGEGLEGLEGLEGDPHLEDRHAEDEAELENDLFNHDGVEVQDKEDEHSTSGGGDDNSDNKSEEEDELEDEEFEEEEFEGGESDYDDES